MKKIGILWLTSLLLWACIDSNSSGSPIDTSNTDGPDSTEFSSSDIQSSSSSKSNDDKSASSSSVNKKKSSNSKDSESGTSNFKDSKSSSSSSKDSESNSSSSKDSRASSSSNKSGGSVPTSSCQEHSATTGPRICSQSLEVIYDADKSAFVLTGLAYIDGWDTTLIDDIGIEPPFFTKVEYCLAHVNEDGQNEDSQLIGQHSRISRSSEPTPFDAMREQIAFDSLDVRIINSTEKQCGTFNLFITYYVTNELRRPEKHIVVDTVEFVRDPTFCQTELHSFKNDAD